MPEYLAPGVYVEETSFRSKVIEGVSTTTTGFIGPTRYGPIDQEPDILTSLVEFEQIYGNREQLRFTDGLVMDNYMWHAARAFFEEGGKRLYVVRTFRPEQELVDTPSGSQSQPKNDGRAWNYVGATDGPHLKVTARFPGVMGKMLVRFTLRLSENVLTSERIPNQPTSSRPTVKSLTDYDVVWISNLASTLTSPPSSETGDFYVATSFYNPATKQTEWRFDYIPASPPISPPLALIGSPPAASLTLNDLEFKDKPALTDKVKIVTLRVTVTGSDGVSRGWDGVALDPRHERAGTPDSLFDQFAERPTSRRQAREIPIVITTPTSGPGSGVDNGLEVLTLLLNLNPELRAHLNDPRSSDDDRSVEILLDNGNDGLRPTAEEYEGKAELTSTLKTGLKAFEDLEDISIVAAPGSTWNMSNGYRPQSMTIVSLLISHATRMRYRIAVLDPGNEMTIADVRAMRAKFDSKYAALYYPWIRIFDPVTQREKSMPPSGFVAGIYARNDINRAVYKAPANEVVNLALGFELMINKAQQEILNPEGINCFRFFEGRGMLLWGARTISSDGEWKYVNLRRYFAYLERSIDRGTQWAVFEPNGPLLWANVRRTIETFLLNEFQMGALLGDKPEQAYFVRCDRSTMTQNDLDNGRLICLIGVSPLRPAEFVIFRIGQWTADRKV